jgi:hypothetical protein
MLSADQTISAKNRAITATKRTTVHLKGVPDERVMGPPARRFAVFLEQR